MIDTARDILQAVCLGGLFFTASVFVAVCFTLQLKRSEFWREVRYRMHSWRGIFAAVFVCGLILYGGSKGFNIQWGEMLENGAWTDEETGLVHNASYVSNTVVHITWTPKYGDLQLADSVYIYARELGSTNDSDWVQISDDGLVVGDLYFHHEGNNLTNYQYYVFSEYVPPSPVVTNGVYHLSGFARGLAETNNIVPVKVPVRVVHGTRLPIGYRECEYLESTGNQYIDTMVNAESGLSSCVELAFVTIPYDASFLAARKDTQRIYLLHYYSYNWRFGYGNHYGGGRAQANTIYEVETKLFVGNQALSVNGEMQIEQMLTTDIDLNLNLYLFACNNNNAAAYPSVVRAYAVKIWKDEGASLVRDFVPALDPNGRPCLFDIVTQQSFYNQGGGEFRYQLKPNIQDEILTEIKGSETLIINKGEE